MCYYAPVMPQNVGIDAPIYAREGLRVKRSLRRFLTGVMATAMLSAAGVVMQAAPADAQTRPIAITSNVYIRPTPNTSRAPLALMPAGSHPAYNCYVDGQNVQGTTKWFRINWNGVTGYYSSVADNIPLALQNNIEGNYGIPRCGTGTDINQGSAAGATVTVQPEQRVTEPYNRAAAVRWALNHAQDVRGNLFADCTWFVSQALWAGGLHQTSWWNDYEKRQGSVLAQPGTDIARGAPNLVSYLKQRFPVTTKPLNGNAFRANSIPLAQPGDIIAYRWSGTGDFDHLAFIVDIAPGQYPEVSEWGTVPFREWYQKRGWTWSMLWNPRPNWLQAKYPGVTAELIHFNLPG